MGFSVIVDRHNFETEVLQASYQQPILVDFFATWCGPCQLLKPMLEKLVQEYDFGLAKIDIDQNPELASTYGVEGVPDVRVVTQGEMLPGFVGVLQEAQIRQLLTQLGLRSHLEQELTVAQHLMAGGHFQEAKTKFDQLFERYPDRPQVTIGAAQLLLQLQQLEEAERLLATVNPKDQAAYTQAQAVRGLIALQQTIAALEKEKQSSVNAQTSPQVMAPEYPDPQTGMSSPVQEQNPMQDLDRQFLRGAKLTLAADYETALDIFLDVVGRDRTYRNDAARKAMLTIFDLLGDSHDLTRTYRKRLTRTLY